MCTVIVMRDNKISKIKTVVKKKEGALWPATCTVGGNLSKDSMAAVFSLYSTVYSKHQ